MFEGAKVPDLDFDVLVVGAGAAGVCATHVLHSLGLRVALVDRRERVAPCFKAEKLEPDQIGLLTEMNLMRLVSGAVSPLREVVIYRGSDVAQRLRIDQFGMHYHSFVNALRDGLPNEVTQFSDTVSDVRLGDDRQSIDLEKGGTVTARLVVVAAGTNSKLRHLIRSKRREIEARHTVAFGFDMALAAGKLPHDGVNFLPDHVADRVGFLTLFPTPNGVRANLFAYHEPQSDWNREMRLNAVATLDRTFSGMRKVLGDYDVVGRVEGASIELWTTDTHPDPGIVLIGDAYQSVCPATGTGLSKVLTDVHVLASEAADWFRTPGMSAAKLATYYDSAEKQSSDLRSLQSAAYSKRLATDGSLRFRLLRLRRDGFAPWRRLSLMR
jgi:2-polyprenyl-6-methoxyphenol hydroxylase-like FAD-dependent oxidoreductase